MIGFFSVPRHYSYQTFKLCFLDVEAELFSEGLQRLGWRLGRGTQEDRYLTPGGL